MKAYYMEVDCVSKILYEIRKNTYYDSVTLMLISKDLEKLPGINKALIGMGTDLNKELVENLNMMKDEIKAVGPNDFFVVVSAEESVEIEDVTEEVNALLNKKKKDSSSDYNPPTLESALNYEPDANMALISVAGEYAAEQAKKALENDLHVMIFSDNVSLKDEKELKELAVEKGLLMMGPDCGTAIINNKALAFANVVKKGNIGIVGASGTGTQEVSVIVDRLGKGVSQVIGTGGRDLHQDIGGLMMLQGLEALNNDPETKVIVLISKTPPKEVAEKVLNTVKKVEKPVVVYFIGGDRKAVEDVGAYSAMSLEDTARKAVALSNEEEVVDFGGYDLSDEEIQDLVSKEADKFNKEQKYFRGLYTGGTLAEEAVTIISKEIENIYSNVTSNEDLSHKKCEDGKGHVCIDFGDDEFTRGKPHPMIDPSIRADYLEKTSNRDDISVVLMDFVLGYGSHEDPVGELLPAIEMAKKKAEERGGHLSIIASICGTEGDPQSLEESKESLEKVGVIVMPSNAQAARLAQLILMEMKKGEVE